LGFAIGSAIAVFNYRLWKRVARSIGKPGAKPRTASAVFLGARYLLLGIVLFAMIKYLGVSPLALLAGLLVPAAAVFVEIVYELFI
jgi:hypothetical protein